MKRLTILGTLAAIVVSVAGFATKADAQYYGYVRTPSYGGNGQLQAGGHYDVWGRLVGSDPNNPIFRDSATANLPWNTPNNFNPNAPDPYRYYPPTVNPYAVNPYSVNPYVGNPYAANPYYGYYGSTRGSSVKNILRGLGF